MCSHSLPQNRTQSTQQRHVYEIQDVQFNHVYMMHDTTVYRALTSKLSGI
uniref:Uncharacterized protein n=1 Tax=Arion vulgaris TaxID=1028688 RepID=A0A0B7B2B3_9EUPU